MSRIGRRTTLLFLTLVLFGLAAAAGAQAADAYESGSPSERQPFCEESTSAIVLDTNPAADATGGTIPRERVRIPLQLEVGDDEVVRFCSGEHWDGQDPNTRNSESDTTASEDGDVYVNPLGDCSGYDGSHPDGCDGGTEKPTPTNPIHLRVTAGADSTAAGDSANRITVYFNGETFGFGRMAIAITYDDSTENGYAALFLEDHTDQIFGTDGILGEFDQGDPLDQGWDGNYLTPIFDPIQGGEVGEGDCSNDRFESGRPCPRDNGAFTLEFGTGWAPNTLS
jgi:hypothetical protein